MFASDFTQCQATIFYDDANDNDTVVQSDAKKEQEKKDHVNKDDIHENKESKVKNNNNYNNKQEKDDHRSAHPTRSRRRRSRSPARRDETRRQRSRSPARCDDTRRRRSRSPARDTRSDRYFRPAYPTYGHHSYNTTDVRDMQTAFYNRPYHRPFQKQYQKPYKPFPTDVAPSKIIGVFNLDPVMTEERIRQQFKQYGHIEKIYKIHHKNYAFIYYDSIEAAEQAKSIMNGVRFGHKKIRVDFSISNGPHD